MKTRKRKKVGTYLRCNRQMGEKFHTGASCRSGRRENQRLQDDAGQSSKHDVQLLQLEQTPATAAVQIAAITAELASKCLVRPPPLHPTAARRLGPRIKNTNVSISM